MLLKVVKAIDARCTSAQARMGMVGFVDVKTDFCGGAPTVRFFEPRNLTPRNGPLWGAHPLNSFANPAQQES